MSRWGLLAVFLASTAQAAEPCGGLQPARITWRAGVDGGPVEGFRLYIGAASEHYDAPREVGLPLATPDARLSYEFDLDVSVPRYLALAAFGPGGEGPRSNELRMPAGTCPPPGVPIELELRLGDRVYRGTVAPQP